MMDDEAPPPHEEEYRRGLGEWAVVPSAISVEESLIATILHHPQSVDQARFLSSGDFESELHAHIWHEMIEMRHRGEAVSFPILRSKLNGSGAALAEIYMNGFVSAYNVEGYAHEIQDRAGRRKMSEIMRDMHEQIADLETPVDEVISRSVAEIGRVATEGAVTGMTKHQVANGVLRGIDLPATCYSTGIRGLDEAMCGGMFAGFLYNIEARKKVGKTTMLGTISHNLNRQGVDHLFIALETPPDQIEKRNIARDQYFNSIRFLKREDMMLKGYVEDYIAATEDHTIYEYLPGLTRDRMRACVARHKSKGKIKGVILDYYQRVTGKEKNETEEYHLRVVADMMAEIAGKDNLFFLTAAQVNQDGNTRGGEGLRLACDQSYQLHRDKNDEMAWMEMLESRYSFYNNVGSAAAPALRLDKNGPHYTDA